MEYVCILQEEKFQGVGLLFAYRRAAQCYRERGMKNEALYFADKATDTAKFVLVLILTRLLAPRSC